MASRDRGPDCPTSAAGDVAASRSLSAGGEQAARVRTARLEARQAKRRFIRELSEATDKGVVASGCVLFARRRIGRGPALVAGAFRALGFGRGARRFAVVVRTQVFVLYVAIVGACVCHGGLLAEQASAGWQRARAGGAPGCGDITPFTMTMNHTETAHGARILEWTLLPRVANGSA